MIFVNKRVGIVGGFFLAPLASLYLVGLTLAAPLVISFVLEDAADVASLVGKLAAAPFAIVLVPLMFVLVGSPFGYLGMFLVGLPSMVLLRHIRAENGFSYGACGFAGGLLLAVILSSGGHVSDPSVAADWRVDGYAGALTLIMFWLIARKPNLVAPAPELTSD